MKIPEFKLTTNEYRGWTISVHQEEGRYGPYKFTASRDGLHLGSDSLGALTDKIKETEKRAVKLATPVKALRRSSGSGAWENVEVLEISGDSFVFRDKTGHIGAFNIRDLLPESDQVAYRDRFVSCTEDNVKRINESHRLRKQANELLGQAEDLLKTLYPLLESELITAVPPVPACDAPKKTKRK